MTTDMTIPQAAALEARRQSLAFGVEQGRDGAVQELEAIEALGHSDSSFTERVYARWMPRRPRPCMPSTTPSLRSQGKVVAKWPVLVAVLQAKCSRM